MRRALALVALLVALPVAAEDTIPWDDADKHVGEQATVTGRVVDVHCSPLSCLLAFEPSFNRFTAVVQAASFDTFPPAELESRFKGREVSVTGKIELRDSKPEIVVESPGALALAGRPRRERATEQNAARAQADVMERLAAVLERVEALTERMADVQERMDNLLAALEQREAALAAATPAPPPAPTYGEPQPRPGFEALRTVKRGMSHADVERLVGEPVTIETGARGWTTWYYGYGRSVSFNERGRVEAAVGFPSP